MRPDQPPYVGEGADGYRRSAQIDREEADTYPTGSPAWRRRMSSAEAWDARAAEAETYEAEAAAAAAEDFGDGSNLVGLLPKEGES